MAGVKVVCVAVKRPDGMLLVKPAPARHHECFDKDYNSRHDECGFLTSTGQFVSRREAYAIALSAGQLKPDALPWHAPVLYSEDLW